LRLKIESVIIRKTQEQQTGQWICVAWERKWNENARDEGKEDYCM
jgi:hypothetical protein